MSYIFGSCGIDGHYHAVKKQAIISQYKITTTRTRKEQKIRQRGYGQLLANYKPASKVTQWRASRWESSARSSHRSQRELSRECWINLSGPPSAASDWLLSDGARERIFILGPYNDRTTVEFIRDTRIQSKDHCQHTKKRARVFLLAMRIRGLLKFARTKERCQILRRTFKRI